jgi:hypothetical protein
MPPAFAAPPPMGGMGFAGRQMLAPGGGFAPPPAAPVQAAQPGAGFALLAQALPVAAAAPQKPMAAFAMARAPLAPLNPANPAPLPPVAPVQAAPMQAAPVQAAPPPAVPQPGAQAGAEAVGQAFAAAYQVMFGHPSAAAPGSSAVFPQS